MSDMSVMSDVSDVSDVSDLENQEDLIPLLNEIQVNNGDARNQLIAERRRMRRDITLRFEGLQVQALGEDDVLELVVRARRYLRVWDRYAVLDHTRDEIQNSARYRRMLVDALNAIFPEIQAAQDPPPPYRPIPPVNVVGAPEGHEPIVREPPPLIRVAPVLRDAPIPAVNPALPANPIVPPPPPVAASPPAAAAVVHRARHGRHSRSPAHRRQRGHRRSPILRRGRHSRSPPVRRRRAHRNVSPARRRRHRHQNNGRSSSSDSSSDGSSSSDGANPLNLSSESASDSGSEGSVSYSESSDSAVLSPDRHEHRHRHRGVRHHRRHDDRDGGRYDRDQFADMKTLLQMKLERFDGSYEKWPVFWACFRSEIHHNPRLAMISRHRLLMQLLEGPARASMAAFVGFPQSYKEAIVQLKRSYNNPTAARDAIVAQFKSRAPMKRLSVSCLRQMLSAFDAVLAALRQLSLKDRSHEPKIASAVREQVPDELKRVLTSLPKKSLRRIRQALDQELRNLESSRKMYLVRSPPVNRAAAAPRANRAHNIASAKLCVFCSADHRPAACPAYPTHQSRVNRVRQLALCARCLHRGHSVETCPQHSIRCFGCGQGHYRYLCPNLPRREERPAAVNVNCVRDGAALPDVNVHWIKACAVNDQRPSPLLNASGRTLLMTMKLDVCANRSNVTIRVLIDPGADVCLVSRRLCNVANLKLIPIGARRLIVGGGAAVSNINQGAEVPIGPVNGIEVGRLRACVVNLVTRPIAHVIGTHTRRLLDERSIEVHDCMNTVEARDTPIDLLIGMDALSDFLLDDHVELTRHLSARRTIVGWCVAGVESFATSESSAAVCMNVRSDDSDLDLSRLWIGEELSVADEIAASTILDEVEKTIEFRDHRYWIGLPWLRKGGFDSNFASALYRLRKLIYRLHAEGRHAEYETELMKLVSDGHAERVPLSGPEKSYYMPHRGVWKDAALSTKLRVVFDASSHRKGQDPLNARLCKGVDLNPSVVALLLRFRFGNVAAVADLQKAFLQIRILHGDRDFLRFLWIGPSGDLQAYRMTSVPFGATCSPFLLASVIRHHLMLHIDQHPSAAKLLGNIYVDDLVITTDSAEQMRTLHDDSVRLFERCSMKLHKWRVSDDLLDAEWADKDTVPETKVLGIRWWPASDQIATVVPKLDTSLVTRRIMLRQLGTLYDPLGLIAPMVARFKVLLRETLNPDSGWDDPVDEQLAVQFRNLVSQLDTLQQLRVPRLVGTSDDTTALVVFCDASAKCIGAVVYVIDWRYGFRPRLLTSRSRLSGTRTTPELELQAAVLAVRLISEVSRCTGIRRWKLYSDASVVLHWIREHPNKLKKVFVSNRVRQILSVTTPSQWAHVAGQDNPADCLSRGLSALQLKDHPLWWNGPESLSALQAADFRTDDVTSLAYAAVFVGRSENVACKWTDLLISHRSTLESGNRECSSADVIRSIWIADQLATFPTEVATLARGQIVSCESPLRKFVPFLDSFGVMRARTRFQSGETDFDSPIVGDARGHIRRAWLEWLHESNGHLGVPALMAHSREYHLLLHLRSVCRSICARCEHCRRLWARPMNPPTGKLPPFRTDGGDAFRYIGIDFFGPVLIARGAKRYVLLITCLTSRAVHLEVLPGMAAKDVWTALRRFFSLRMVPFMIYSDNGPGFARVSREIDELNDRVKRLVSMDCLPATIKWKFSSPFAPHQGGVFERLVGVVKSHIPATVGSNRLSACELTTILYEVAAIVNSRPIGLLDDGTPLTPGHLVAGSRPLSWPALDRELPNVLLASHEFFTVRNCLLQRFWAAWRRSYLSILPGRYSVRSTYDSVKIGEHVLIIDRNAPRGSWRVGEIVKVLPGPDGIVRNVEVKVNGVVYSRAVQYLAKLERDPPVIISSDS